MKLVVRVCGFIVLALGTAATVAGLALPWTLSGGLRPDLTTIAGIAFLGPLLGLLCLAYARHEPRRFRLIAAVAAVAAVAALLVAVGLARLVSPSAGVAVGGPLTVAGTAFAGLGWVLLLVAGPGRVAPTGRRSWLAGAATVALVLVTAFIGIDWAREGRFVDATTAGARPAGSAPAWPLQLAGVQLVGVHDELAILRGTDGIRAVWLGTGTTAWQYLRSDLPSSTAGLVDGAVVVVFGTDDGILVTALDAGTGAERFSRRFAAGKMATVRAAGRLAILSNLGIGAGDLLGIDARDGALRWRWTPERNGGPCDVTDLASTSETVAVAMRCRATGVDDMAVGLAADSGAERWSWHAIQRTNPELRVFAAGSGFVTVTGVPHRATYMDAVTGSVGARHDAAGALAVAAGAILLYAEPSADRPHLAAVDARTGGVKWDVALPGLGGHQPLTAAADGERAHLLWRSADGALRLVTVATENGAMPASPRTISCPTTCPDTTAVAADAGHTAVTVRDPKATTLYLTVP
ncbi:PQQ-binding-like beta-propeller repeat protein [Dactylosporangium sp. AC04546]|uniref:outer membrane protein assembly factor BamB family protein n=1 Tax=Dactylosporangium sp. AC04546 TaxID=2862460 RepID=UPI001EE0395D|nr:PQQ-binding-like beta-propeller repeat protein [Dactylosporangium sp. AC04546]WVK83113.1 PQQ-binding-like beta-propeller repeat protein [Dactylosporangium sp. AC04546]